MQAHRGPGRLSPPPSFLPTSPATPANLSGTPGRKKERRGKARPPGLQPQRETPRGKTNLGSRLREERAAGNRGPADASGSSTSLRDPSPARAPGPPISRPGLATAAADRPRARGPPDGEVGRGAARLPVGSGIWAPAA